MAKWLLLLSLIAARPAYAGDGLDVKDWLSRPGVKLLAVEFYATWCGPCKKAVPQWKALHEKYRDQGLRLVVVSVQDPDGACVNPGWNPDDVVCDAEGRLAEAWGVGDKLPAAFLWTWRGPLLVRKGHVEEVGRAVEEELARLPRVTLDRSAGLTTGEGMDGQVRELLRTELARTGKVDVVAGADEEAALAAIRRKSHEVQFSDRSACKLGQRLAANSLLKASFVKAGSGKRLLVQIFSAESGCLNASAGVFWNEKRPALSVAEAVAELVNNLRVGVDLPASGGRVVRVEEKDLGRKVDDWTVESEAGVVVTFQSDPEGAAILVDGRMVCTTTPCSRTVTTGSHKIEMQRETWRPESKVVDVQAETRSLSWKLTPDFGWVTVRSVPSALPVTLDKKPVGVTPLERHQVKAGPHQIMVASAEYYEKGKQVVVEPAEHEEIDLTLEPREGGLAVKAQDQQGNDLAAEVWVDGEKRGTTPFGGKLAIGTHQVRVVMGDQSWEDEVQIRERQTEKRVVKLEMPLAVPEPVAEPVAEPIAEPAVEKKADSDERRKNADRERLYLALAFYEGFQLVDGNAYRTNVSADAAFQVRFSRFRWEVVNAGAAFESPHAITVGTAGIFDLFGFYVRAGFEGLFAEGNTYWGVRAGLGYAVTLAQGWYLDVGANVRVIQGADLLWPVDGQLGVRYGF